jgi:hypothetical protein
MKKTLPIIIYKTGRILTLLGIVMFFITAFMFSYRGDWSHCPILIHEIISYIGVISFWSCFPAIIFGAVFWSFKKVAK